MEDYLNNESEINELRALRDALIKELAIIKEEIRLLEE